LQSCKRSREAISGLRRQDAGANIGAADGPQGKPQDAARFPVPLSFMMLHKSRWVPACAGMTRRLFLAGHSGRAQRDPESVSVRRLETDSGFDLR
jgi:hypothetical protein